MGYLFLIMLVITLCAVITFLVSFQNSPSLNEEQKEQFLKARYILNKDSGDKQQAHFLLNEVISKVPNYLPAYEVLVKSMFENAKAQEFSNSEQVNQLKNFLKVALKYDSHNSVINLYQARLSFLVDWDFVSAQLHFEQALPSAQSHRHYGQFLLAMREFESALYHTKQYQYLDPDGYSSESVAWVYMMSANRDEALKELEKLRPYAQSSFYYHVCLQALYEQVGAQEDAFREMLWLLNKAGYNSSDLEILKAEFEKEGLNGVYAWLLFEDKKQFNIGQYKAPISLARYATYLGEDELAISYLQSAKQQKQIATLWVAADPKFKSLYNNAEFRQFLKSINLSI